MKINENILKEFINIPNNIYELVNDYICEVESFKNEFNIKGLVVAKVVKKEKHENADLLSVLKVNLGDGKLSQIVCGAKNVEEGQFVIAATVGTILPGNFVIKKSNIRGVESCGMICSLKELGFEDKNIPEKFKNGIFFFEDFKNLKPGDEPLSILGLNGFVLELSLTPNRGDLLSHYGFAQDLAAVIKKKVKLPKISFSTINVKNQISVKCESKNVNKYYVRYIKDVKIMDSPWWLKSFLISMGLNPINNVVDITNFILYTFGTPMHAFDADKFEGDQIVIKDNCEALEIETLDNQIKKIEKNEIIITNGKDIKALGGIMGLKNSAIDEKSTNLILELASFNSKNIAKTSKKIGIKTDSSLRFERGIDENIMEYALNYACYLIEKLANGKILNGTSKYENAPFNNQLIEISSREIAKKIGQKITLVKIISILKRLNYEIIKDNKKIFVKAPSYRKDILIKDDVLEEIIRIYGMNNIKSQQTKTSGVGLLTDKQKKVRKLRNYLAAIGLNETISYSILNKSEVFKFNKIGDEVSILKPLNQERTTLRQSLINGLLETYHYNKARGIDNVNIFEIGHIYAKGIEKNNLGVLLESKLNYNLWKNDNKKLDFYFIAGILKNVMALLNVDYELKISYNDAFFKHIQAEILSQGKVVGIIGKIHPKIASDIYILEICLDELEERVKFLYNQTSKYPSVKRDLSIVLKDDVSVDEVIKNIYQTGGKTIFNVSVFDVYKGKNINNDEKSIGIRITLSNNEKTLETQEIEKIITRITKKIEYTFNGKIRKN